MNIAILSRKNNLYSTWRFREAASRLGHAVTVLDPLRCEIVTTRGGCGVYYKGSPVEGVDAVLPRIGASITDYGLAVVRQFELWGVPVLNEAEAIARSRDKLRCLQLMVAAGLRIPRTYMARSPAKVKEAIDLVGGVPVVLKLLQGTQGIGVILADSLQVAESTLDTLWSLGQDILIQEYIKESQSSDIRALVVGRRVVAAMRRTGPPGDFRSNIHRGGKGKCVKLTPEQERMALEAVDVLGLEVAGVDMLEGRDGPLMMEVNSSPGFRGLEKATGADVAAEIIAHAALHARRCLGVRAASEAVDAAASS